MVLARVALVVAMQAELDFAAGSLKIYKTTPQSWVSGEKGQVAVFSLSDYEIHVLRYHVDSSKVVSGAFESVQGRTIKTGIMLDAVMEGVKMLQKHSKVTPVHAAILGESRDRGR